MTELNKENRGSRSTGANVTTGKALIAELKLLEMQKRIEELERYNVRLANESNSQQEKLKSLKEGIKTVKENVRKCFTLCPTACDGMILVLASNYDDLAQSINELT